MKRRSTDPGEPLPAVLRFVGLAGYQIEAPFAPSLFVEIRERMGQGVFEIFQGAIIDALEEAKAKKKSQSRTGHSTSEPPPEGSDDDPPAPSGGTPQEEERRGKLILDARWPRRRSATPQT